MSPLMESCQSSHWHHSCRLNMTMSVMSQKDVVTMGFQLEPDEAKWILFVVLRR